MVRTGILVLLLSGLSHSASGGWEELVVNGGFESGSSGWTMKNLSLQTSNVYEGSQAAQMTPGTYYYQGYQYIDINEGDELVAFAAMASDGIVGSANVSLRFFDSGSNLISSVGIGGLTGTNTYDLYTTGGLFAPTGATQVMVRVGALGVQGGTYYVDSISLMRRTPDDGTQVLVNGSFDGGSSGWVQKHATYQTTTVLDGDGALQLSAWTYYKFFYQDIAASPGQVFKASAYVKADGVSAGSTGISIRFRDASGNDISSHSIGYESGTTNWNYHETAEITAPAGTATLHVRGAIGTNAGGYGYFDRISVLDVTPQTGPQIVFSDQQNSQMLTNGGFENGFADWTKNHAQLQTTDVYEGAQAIQLPTATYYKQTWHRQAALPGEVYSASVMAACSDITASVGMGLRFRDASLNVIGGSSIGSLTSTRRYRQYSTSNVRAPANTAYVEIHFGAATGTYGGYAYFDQVSLLKNTGLPITVVSTFESAGVTVLTDNVNANCEIYFKKVTDTQWQEAYPPMFDDTNMEFRGSIINLESDSEYQVYAILTDNGTVIDEGGASFSTWQSNPTIAQTYNVTDLYTSGQFLISDLQGTPDGWIKIVGTGTNDVDGAYATDGAIHLLNSAFIILENVQIIGGRRYGIHIDDSYEIRVINCDISGYARTPAVVQNGISYESKADANADLAINMDGGIYLDESQKVLVERCYVHDPRLSANTWQYGHPKGPQGIVVKNNSRTGNAVVRYNDIIGSDHIRWNDGIEGYDNNSVNGSFARDSDIHGNMICYGNDDAIELDGGQENVRFFENKTQGFLCGVSTAPNRKGPCYIFGNLIGRLGEERGNKGAMVKQGGGDTYTRGFSYFFNNTMYSSGYGGICGVGFGDDTNRAMFFAVTRNNIVYGLGSNTEVIEDEHDVAVNSFDFDNLWNVGLTQANVEYAPGNEANGILNDEPSFDDASSDLFTLTSFSSAIDMGTILPNFAVDFEGSAPDQGAFEFGSNTLMPIRPVDITADTYRVTLNAVAGSYTDTVYVTLDIGNLDGGSTSYKIAKNATTSWLNVSSASGTITSNSTLILTVTVDVNQVVTGEDYQGVFLVRLANGLSIPITVEADVN
ncbi:MAG TPA: hypothetical protein DER01_22715 [Phycisphaerales bacterium]|nr:hypothetical protein [Phycisphaerales bacterium]